MTFHLRFCLALGLTHSNVLKSKLEPPVTGKSRNKKGVRLREVSAYFGTKM